MKIKIKRTITRIFDKSIKVNWLLKTMVLISTTYSLVFFLFNLSVVLFKDSIINFVANGHFPKCMYFYRENLMFFFTANRFMYLLCVCIGVVLLNGCHLLFRGYKWGLVYYTVGKVLQIIVPFFFLGIRMISIGDIMIVFLFLVFYYWYAFTHNIDKKDREFNKIEE
ncbi:MAG: hypothetical protein LKE30_06100 [Bacteroidales bacterium]|jgi:hypothetical protein|nr:hypothetical protein [Bacteroidales bacterium]